LIRFDYRIDLMIGRAMKRPLEVAFFNQEIIDQKLSSDVNGYHLWRILQIRRRHWLTLELFPPRRPNIGQYDPVVKSLPGQRKC